MKPSFPAWLLADGSDIQPGDALFTLESEKATQDIESIDGGILRIPPDGPKANDRLTVGTVIGYLVAKGEAAPFERGDAPSHFHPASRERQRPEESSPRSRPSICQASARPRPDAESTRRSRREHAALPVPSASTGPGLHGGGTSGRIRERDVRAVAVAAPAGKRLGRHTPPQDHRRRKCWPATSPRRRSR